MPCPKSTDRCLFPWAAIIAVWCCATNGWVGGAEPDAKAAPANLSVVRIWGELLDQKPIKLSTGGEIRLGISTLESTIGTAITLYCLTKDTFDQEGKTPGDVLGPLQVSVKEPGTIRATEAKVQRGATLYPEHV